MIDRKPGSDSVTISRDVRVDVELTPRELAACFAVLCSDGQAEFFDALAEIGEGWWTIQSAYIRPALSSRALRLLEELEPVSEERSEISAREANKRAAAPLKPGDGLCLTPGCNQESGDRSYCELCRDVRWGDES